MSRDIKYRQRVDGGFHYWGYIDGVFIGPITNQEPNPVNDQFTGLKDKIGVEWWEGDVCKITYDDDNTWFEIVFQDGAFRKKFPEWDSDTPYNIISSFDLDHYTSVGNIHENPDLLEVE